MKLEEMVNGPILDVPCPHCEGINTDSHSTDELEFSYDGTGHYYVDYHCYDCGKDFRVYFDFEYKVTKASYRS